MNDRGRIVGVYEIVTLISGCVRIIDRHCNEFCLGEPYYSNLCMATGIVYPEYTDSVESAGKTKDLLLDVTKDSWAICVGETDRIKLEKVGAIFKNTRLGAAFEG